MTAIVIQFPAGGGSAGLAPEPPEPYEFFYAVFEDMEPERRDELIDFAHRCGIFDDRDHEIFMSSWADQFERRQPDPGPESA